MQYEVGDVTWYELALRPEIREGRDATRSQGAVFASCDHRGSIASSGAPFTSPGRPGTGVACTPGHALCASYLAPLSRDLLRTLREDRPDLLFTQDNASGKFDVLLAIAAGLGIPLVARHAGSRPEGYVGKVAKRWTIRQADLMIASGAA